MHSNDSSTELGSCTQGLNRSDPPGLSGPVILTLVTGCAILWVLLYPFHFGEWDGAAWLSRNRIAKLNTFSNIVLFMPYGAAAAWLGATVFPQSRRWVVGLVVVDAALLSFAAETLQVLQVERESSYVDIAANTLGGLIGATVGWSWSGQFTTRWSDLDRWLALRPVAKRCILVLATVLIVRAAPFDVSLETRYLRLSLRQTRIAGWPMAATQAWWGDTSNDAWLWRAARDELMRTAVCAAMFAAAVVAVGKAIDESSRRSGDRVYPLGMIVLFGVLLVLATELLQWPIRSRLMDASDAAGGIMGVLTGGLIGLGLHWQRES